MPFHLLHFISVYGYFGIFLGGIFEGESIMLLSGLLSHENYLSFPGIVFWAFLGAVVGDWGWFFLGRYKGERILNRWPWFKKFMGRPVSFIKGKPARLSFLMRFMYGFRHIVPFSIGMSELPARIFMFWNALGVAVWATVFGAAGYILADILVTVLGNLRRYELILAVVIVLLIALGHLIYTLVRGALKKAVVES